MKGWYQYTKCEKCGQYYIGPKCRKIACVPRGSVPRICRYCGKAFTTSPREVAAGNGKYCSNRCARFARYRGDKRDLP